ncbi:MAG: hypothetical protein Q8N81_02215 [bacterium]|nr:hypothetical protein [bacterium]
MKTFFQGLGAYIVSLAIALLTSVWAGKIFFSDNRFYVGNFFITSDVAFSIYGILITYPFFVIVGLLGFVARHRAWWLLAALAPLFIVEFAFGPELITYSLLAVLAGGAVGYGLSRFVQKRAGKQN